MPLFYHTNINDNIKFCIWKITEQECFFKDNRLNIFDSIKNPKIRIQKKVGRFLLLEMDDNFPIQDIISNPRSKPYLENKYCFFSISHSGNYVATILSKHYPVGIDIQKITSKIFTVSKKFLSEEELLFLKNRDYVNYLTTLFWSSKECFYKGLGLSNITFKDITIRLEEKDNTITMSHKSTSVQANYLIKKDFVLVWLISPF